MTKMLAKAGLIIFLISSAFFYFKNRNVISSETEERYFSSNMDKVRISDLSDHEMEFNGWPDLLNHPYVAGIYLNNSGGSSFAFQEIRKDPVDSATKVMYAQVIDDDPNMSGTSRAQLSLEFNDDVDLPIYHTSHRMYLSTDLDFLSNYPSSIHWFTLFEIWNKRNDEWSGDRAGSCRWNLALYKETGVGQPLYWQVEAERMQPSSEEYLWKFSNNTVPVPLGKWFTMDVFMKRGEGNNGRFTIKITVDGATSTICDVANTTLYPGHPELPISTFQPFKLYTDDAVLDWMRANNKIIAASYNNFIWYKN